MTGPSEDPLERFVTAQQAIYSDALGELAAGQKQSHWMWFIFPQIAGLGLSPTARHYAIADLVEARRYLAHPVLGPRLVACARALLGWAGQRSAEQVLGGVDALKCRSSATLFEAADGDAVFSLVLDAFYDGVRDPLTLEQLRA